MSSFENHPDIVNYLNNLNNQNSPSVEIIANAYYARDQHMNLSYDHIKEFSLRKLGYTSSSIQRIIENRFTRYMQDIVLEFNNNHYINNNNVNNNNVNNNNVNNENNANINQFNMSISELFNRFRNRNEIINLINERQNRSNNLSNINTHLEFYRSMTCEELNYLGW